MPVILELEGGQTMKHAFKKTLAILLVLAMVIGVIPSVFAAKVAPFTDVDDSDWFAPFVKYVYEHDPQLMNGTSATTFSPDAVCTRAQIVTFLWRANGKPAADGAASFSDVAADAYYAPAVLWAVSEGITVGTGETTFSPDSNCTRAQIVTFLYRNAEG